MDQWHFARPELAKHYLELLSLGISSNLAIIAPRRKGKTLFILQDLAPAAEAEGYLPLYASLWQNINAPHEGIISSLEESIQNHGNTLTRLLKPKIKKTTLSNELLGKMGVEFADYPSSASSQSLIRIEQLICQLEDIAGKRTPLLLIDEVQHLATSQAFSPLAHALRTLLDKRQGRIKTVFTGSSRHYMNLLFNESQSPFYHFVEPIPFPDLDQAFIEFLVGKMRQDHQIQVAISSLLLAFNELDKSPYWMMKLVSYLITHQCSATEALEHTLMLIEAAEGYERLAQRLKPIDKLLFTALCNGENPFNKGLLDRIDKETHVKGIPPNVQRALRRLQEANLISQILKGEYFIEKPGFKRYLEK